ncbi:MAG: glycosyltransferase family 39 protein [Deltaproteobacteria bacterium]|nr:glycosyltransferase family 39 protein [Deltaproteobacteria bacterium]
MKKGTLNSWIQASRPAEPGFLRFIRDNAVPIALSALIGMVADFAFSNWFLSVGVPPGLSLFLSFFPSSILSSSWWVLKWIENKEKVRLDFFIFIYLMALFLRGGIYDIFIRIGWPVQASIIAVVIATVIHSYIGIAFIHLIRNNPELRWKAISLAVAGYMFVLRLYYIGSVELLPQEAYYWLYARHLDIGYLDHPPMVAWIIWANSLVFGNSEFSIRFGAFLLWMAAAFFCFGLTRNLSGKTAGFVAICLFSVLPFFFAIGFVMTPDAPLTACWAGALYFLERALIGKKRLAWWGAGICVGLGMLSKYTIALLLPSALLFMLIDRESRGWLLRPEPFAAVLVSIFLFLPVIIWNAQHDWVSFIFQGPMRLRGELSFNLPQLLGSVILLLTPIGAAAVFSGFRKLRVKLIEEKQDVFSLVFLLCPFLVFFLFSFVRDVKLNWTGPLWIMALPIMAGQMISVYEASQRGMDLFLKRAWALTVIVCIFFWGASLHFLALGAPGIKSLASLHITGTNSARKMRKMRGSSIRQAAIFSGWTASCSSIGPSITSMRLKRRGSPLSL